ncbi:MAG: (d)CMP kinase [Candidatus Omnitrophica bacterium]|nr:(d)CMP kinase [Candidatus Omnitrophota bacterium]
MIIAIDGPAGAGKSTIAKRVAKKKGFLYIDTGAMYRALTLKVIESKTQVSELSRIIQLAQSTTIDLVPNQDGALKVLLDGRDVSKEIREPRITKLVSDISKIKEVRQVMLELQRRFGRGANSVLDGRDIGTVVFPQAEKKFYLDANFNERVSRRHKELLESGQDVTFESVAADLSNRDRIDSTREVAPLKQAEDAIYLDTTNMTIDQVVEVVLNKINSHG